MEAVWPVTVEKSNRGLTQLIGLAPVRGPDVTTAAHPLSSADERQSLRVESGAVRPYRVDLVLV
jgi:hypothetical protein